MTNGGVWGLHTKWKTRGGRGSNSPRKGLLGLIGGSGQEREVCRVPWVDGGLHHERDIHHLEDEL